jgi:hypothetical protein
MIAVWKRNSSRYEAMQNELYNSISAFWRVTKKHSGPTNDFKIYTTRSVIHQNIKMHRNNAYVTI